MFASRVSCRQCFLTSSKTSKLVGRSTRRLYASNSQNAALKNPSQNHSIDSRVISALRSQSTSFISLSEIVSQYIERAGHTLPVSLPPEPGPVSHRRINFDNISTSIVILAHIAVSGFEQKISISSGFAIRVPGLDHSGAVIVSCAHTLEEMRHNGLYKSAGSSSATFIITSLGNVYPVSAVLSSLPRSDLILFGAAVPPEHHPPLEGLPINPYPLPEDSLIRTHLVSFDDQHESPGLWQHWKEKSISSRWVAGKVLGYRDSTGRESKPGTYDTLSHILCSTIPTPGSSGGPIVDEETKSVVGIVTGSAMVSRVEGQRGFGTPAEALFEMFDLPGLPRHQ